MSMLLKLAHKLRLIEYVPEFDKIDVVPNDVLVIPRGTTLEGEIHTSLPVVVEGHMHGSLNVRGSASLVVMEGATVEGGLISANRIEIAGEVNNVGIDVEKLRVSCTGVIGGRSQVRYDKLSKHDDAPIEGLMERRTTERDGFAHQVSHTFTALSE